MGDFRVFVPDLFKRNPAKSEEEAEHCMNTLDWGKAVEYIGESYKHLQKDFKKVSIMGFCMGGALTFASITKIQGWHSASPFYGIPDLTQYKLSNITCPTLAHFGENDDMKDFSDPPSVKKLQEEVDKTKAPVQIKIWPNAGHAFSNQDSPNFNPSRRDASFRLTSDLFSR